MYKNIIFDLGGVVVDFKPRDFLMDHFLNKSAEDEVFDLTFGSKEWEELDRGVISRGTANRLMLENAAERGRTFEVQAVIDEWRFPHRLQGVLSFFLWAYSTAMRDCGSNNPRPQPPTGCRTACCVNLRLTSRIDFLCRPDAACAAFLRKNLG